MYQLHIEGTTSRRRGTLIALLLVMAGGYVLLSDLMGGTLFAAQVGDSYTLQTWNWLQGRMYIENGESYTWLELAIYQDVYYVSFPPVPSVLLIPWVILFGMDVPSNLICGLYGLISAALAYEIMLTRGREERTAAFWALFTVWGSNMLWMTTDGSVWFQAQALNMMFCLAGVLAAFRGRRAWATAFLALAVGCRPMSAVFLPVFFFLFVREDRQEYGLRQAVLRQWRCLIGPVIVAAGLMAYNYARFGNPLEFGHNYLPEFVRAEHGQFHISYLWPNLKQILFGPISITGGRLSFSLYNGFMFYIANPLYLVMFVYAAESLFHPDRRGGGLLLAGIGTELLLLCMHRTMGGWQFGARYTCDMLPFALMYLALRDRPRARTWELTVGGLAVAFNAYGVIYMYLYG
ncbi:MAG: hypothetical protein LUC89_02320 [Oscillospiraceae bacterium]|nr:hypothetical protein [Oscillospiraceae bacterium]